MNTKNQNQKKSPRICWMKTTFLKTCQTRCCDDLCLRGLSYDFVHRIRNYFASKEESSQREYLYSLRITIGDHHIVDGKRICKKGFLMLFRTSRRRLSAINQKIQSNAVSFVRSNKGVPKENTTIDLVREWIRTWIQGNCDQMPDNGNVHAPVGFTIRNLFKELKSHLPGEFCLSESYFYALLPKEYPKLKFPEVQRFAKCSTCNELTKKRDSLWSTKASCRKGIETALR